MSTTAIKQPQAAGETVQIKKESLIAAWRLMERLVVSLDRIGSFYSTPAEDVPQTPEQRQSMLEAVGELMGPDTFREMAHVRRLLDELIDDEEGEVISDSLRFWSAPSGKSGQAH